MRLLLVLALAVATLLFARARYSPPEALPETAPAATFSGARARASLARVIGGEPHPAGSDAATRVRERIRGELENYGYTSRVQRSFACGRHGACAFVANVVAELPGKSRDAVLVSAHYDSVPASGGANDDGTGVACVLEIARALKFSPEPRRSVIFVFNDAEEDGLLGALAFAQNDPDFTRVRAAVNLDARGSRGPSTIFETSPGGAGIVRLLGASVPRPVTSSLFYTIYERMPNDTDFTVWKARARGANFAFLGNIQHYHTTLDRLENTDPGTMQQQGDGALALTRALVDADLSPTGDCVWFDVLALGIVRWNASLTRAGAALAVLAVGLAIGLDARRGRVTPVQALTGLGAVPLAVGGAGLIGTAMTRTLALAGASPAPWTANGSWTIGAMWLLGIGLAAAATALLARAGEEGLWSGVWGTFALGGTLAGWTLPGVSYLLIVPALAAGLSGIATRTRAPAIVKIALPALVTLVLWSPVVFLLYDAVGLLAAPLAAMIAALLATTFAPMMAPLPARERWLAPGALSMGALVSATIAAAVAPFSPEIPSRANVIFDENESTARILVDTVWGGRAWGPVPAPMRGALGPAAHDAPRFPWASEIVLAANAPRTGIAPPEMTALAVTSERDLRRLTVHLRSLRGARTLAVVMPPDTPARIARAGNADVPEVAPRPGEWRGLRLIAVPEEGITLELLAPATPIDLSIYDETSGVPAHAAPVVAARPLTATPSQRGDVTIISRRIQL